MCGRSRSCRNWRLATLETFATLLTERSGQQLVYANLAQEVGVAVDTARRWIDLLGWLH